MIKFLFQEPMDTKEIKLTRRLSSAHRYSAIALKINGVFKYVTKTGGQGEPYLQGNDIVFSLNESINEIEIIWPKQIGAHNDNHAQIAQLEIYVTSGRRLKFENQVLIIINLFHEWKTVQELN